MKNIFLFICLLFPLVLFAGCDCDNPIGIVGSHTLHIKNMTWYVDEKNDGIDIFVTGEFSIGQAKVKTRLDYLQQMSLNVIVGNQYTITYLIPDKKEKGIAGDFVSYILICTDLIWIYPNNSDVYIDSPVYLDEFRWISDPEERQEILGRFYP